MSLGAREILDYTNTFTLLPYLHKNRRLHNASWRDITHYPSRAENEKTEATNSSNASVPLGISSYGIVVFFLTEQDFRLNFYFRQAWQDLRLRFSTTDGKTKRIQLPEDSWKQIWLPDTFIRASRKVKVEDDMSSNRMLKVNSEGGVWYVMK